MLRDEYDLEKSINGSASPRLIPENPLPPDGLDWLLISGVRRAHDYQITQKKFFYIFGVDGAVAMY